MFISSARKYILAMVCVIALAACDKVSQANYDKIQTDMSRAEVTKILGEPSETSSVNLGIVSGTSSAWKSEKNGAITIQFVNEKVKTKNFSK